MGKRAVVATVVVVGVLAGAAAVADRVLHEQTEQRLATELRDQIPGLDAEPDVTIEGFPFLTQVLAGELGQVDVSAPEATVEGLLLEDVEVRLNEVSTDRPNVAGRAHMTAFTSLDSMAAALDLPLDLTIDGEHLVATTELLGLPVEVLLLPTAGGQEVLIDIDAFRIGGATVSAADLPSGFTDQLQGLSFPIEGLPEGLELTEVTLEPDGAQLVAEGTDVVLEAQDVG